MKRPFSVIGVTLVFMVASAFYLTRMITTLLLWRFLSNIYVFPSLFYLVLSGFCWSTMGIILSVACWYGKKWTWHVMRITFPVYFLYLWIEHITLSTLTEWKLNWPFMFGLTIISIVLFYWICSRPKFRQYFNAGSINRGQNE